MRQRRSGPNIASSVVVHGAGFSTAMAQTLGLGLFGSHPLGPCRHAPTVYAPDREVVSVM